MRQGLLEKRAYRRKLRTCIEARRRSEEGDGDHSNSDSAEEATLCVSRRGGHSFRINRQWCLCNRHTPRDIRIDLRNFGTDRHPSIEGLIWLQILGQGYKNGKELDQLQLNNSNRIRFMGQNCSFPTYNSEHLKKRQLEDRYRAIINIEIRTDNENGTKIIVPTQERKNRRSFRTNVCLKVHSYQGVHVGAPSF